MDLAPHGHLRARGRIWRRRQCRWYVHSSLQSTPVLTDTGQLPQNIALRLKESGVNVLGTDPSQIDRAEDRHKFSAILDSVGVDQPEWAEVASVKEAKDFANRVG